MIGINESSIQKFDEKGQLWLLSSVLDDIYQQIFLKALLVETSSIRKFDENIQFCK